MLERNNPAIYEVTSGLNLIDADTYSLETLEIGYGALMRTLNLEDVEAIGD